MKHLNCFTSVGAIFLFTVLVSAMHAAPPQYAVTVLDNLSNGINSHGYGINSSGQVAGTDGARHAVQWTGMTPTNLLTLGGTFTLNYGINISGQMVGYGDITGNSAHHAIRWTGTTPTDLGTLGGTFSFASGINDSGQVAGYANITGNTANHAVRWTGTMPTDLGILPGGTLSQAFSINASGQVAGFSTIIGGNQHAVRWTGTTPTDLGTLGGTSSIGYGINASGQVAGVAYTVGGDPHAVLWNGATPIDLGTLGGTRSEAYALNAIGDVIGISFLVGGSGATESFLYTGGTMYDLNSLLVPGSGVTNLNVGIYGNSLNDLGQIAATGSIAGQEYALLLTPTNVPEPSTPVFLAIGLAGLFLKRIRKSDNS